MRPGFLLLLALAASYTFPMANAQDLAAERISAIRATKINSAEFTSVEHETSPTLTVSDDRKLENIPPRTIVKLALHPAPRSNIRVEIWLPEPEKWNGRFLGLGNGGSAGNIKSESFVGPLGKGYAVASTDMGTSPNADSGIGNPEVWKDFGFRATHLMTVAAKQVIRAHYGRDAEFSYFQGGSTGGQQALQEAQRYPEDYDGIVAAIPAHCRTPLHAYFLWNDQILDKCPFTPEQEAAVIAAANEHLAPREVPAAAGKYVSDPRGTPEDITAIITLARQKDPTLTDAHAEALRKIFEGPRHAVTGERLFNGLPFGSTFHNARGHLYLFKWVFGAEVKLEALNFAEDIDKYTAALGPYLNAENPDLSAFAARGGKLIMTSGSVDSVVPPQATIDYYERVIQYFGSLEKVREFYNFYLIPGMAHGGGPGLASHGNLLDMVRAWREKGTAPQELPGKRMVDGKVELEIPIYPYPAQTAWDAATSTYKPIDGHRGGVERVAERFRPAAKE